MNLVREILLVLEEDPSGLAPEDVDISGYTDEQIGYHILLLIEAGFIEGQKTVTYDSSSPSAIATRITWAGHEFLDEARDKKVGKKPCELLKRKVGVLSRLES